MSYWDFVTHTSLKELILQQTFIAYLFLNVLFRLEHTLPLPLRLPSFISALTLPPNSIHSSGLSLMYKIYGALSMKHFARVTCLIPTKTLGS